MSRHRTPGPERVPVGVLPPEQERKLREWQREGARVLPPEIEKEFQELVVAAIDLARQVNGVVVLEGDEWVVGE